MGQERVIRCARCGTEIRSSAPNRKYCKNCRREAERERDREVYASRKAAYRARKKREKKLRERGIEPQKSSAGDSCKRWKTCRYGAETDRATGRCDYFAHTGHCKIITLPDGTRTVEPGANCRFYEPRVGASEKKASIEYAVRNGTGYKRVYKGCGVVQMDRDGDVIREYESMAEAAKAVGLNNSGAISMVCAGRQKTAGGYRWKKAEGDEL